MLGAPFWKAQPVLLRLASERKERSDKMLAGAPAQKRSPPTMTLLCDNTDVVAHFHKTITGKEVVEDGDDSKEEGRLLVWSSASSSGR